MGEQILYCGAMLTDHGILLFASLLLGPFFLYRIYRQKQVWQAFGNLPAYFVPVSPVDILNRIAASISPWLSGGDGWGWRNGYERQGLREV